MILAMPSPIKIGTNYYLRVRTPQDLLPSAAGRIIHLLVAGAWRSVKVGTAVKTSLLTSDAEIAKERFAETYGTLQQVWRSLRSSPAPLTHKQMHALAGELHKAFVDVFDEEPGPVAMWARVLCLNNQAREGRFSPLAIGSFTSRARDLELRFGPFVDIKLMQKGLSISAEQRGRLLEIIADALDHAAETNLRKAAGDYSVSFEDNRYPVFSASGSIESSASHTFKPAANRKQLTFTSVIDVNRAGFAGG